MEASILTTVVLPGALFIIMLGVGLSLVLDDFKRVLVYPKATIVGLVNQLILLPIIAFAVVSVLKLDPMIAVGFMLISACPGGVTSNLITHVAKGDTALSITLTAISSCITVLTIPLIVSFALNHFLGSTQTIELPIFKTIMQIIGITILPVSIGMLINKRFPAFAARMDKPTRVASVVIFILIILGIVLSNLDLLKQYLVSLGSVSLLLLLSTMLLGFLSARWLKLELPQQISISVETGIQNGTLAIVIATAILLKPELALPAAIYSLMMYLPAGLMIWYFGRKRKAAKA